MREVGFQMVGQRVSMQAGSIGARHRLRYRPLSCQTAFTTPFLAKCQVLRAKALEIKQQLSEEYHPARDYYRAARQAIIRSGGKSITDDDVTHLSVDKPRICTLLNNYNRLIKTRNFRSISTQPSRWQHAGITIPVTYELSYAEDGKEYLYKIYFKSLKPDARDCSTIYQLMIESTMPDELRHVGLIDLERGRIIKQPSGVPSHRSHLALQLNAERLETLIRDTRI